VSRRLLVAVFAVGAVCLVAPAAALAGTASSDGTTITYTTNAGEENFVQVLPSGIGGCLAPAGETCVEEVTGVPVTAAGDCDQAGANEAH
jgi:hypothetical protein